jgi:hypothetical protein
MTTEALAYTAALYVVALAVGVQLGALWGARVTRSEATRRADLPGYGDCTPPETYPWVAAYPFGGMKRMELPNAGGKRFRTAAEAHAYLIENGSESPWEEVE